MTKTNTSSKKQYKWKDKKYVGNEISSFIIGGVTAVYVALLLYWYQLKEGTILDVLLHLLLLYVGIKYAYKYSQKRNNKGVRVVNETTLVTFLIVGAIIYAKLL